MSPHGIDEEPTSPLGYVTLEGQEGNAVLAIYRNGQWCDRKVRPFSVPVVKWFSVEKADGSLIF